MVNPNIEVNKMARGKRQKGLVVMSALINVLCSTKVGTDKDEEDVKRLPTNS